MIEAMPWPDLGDLLRLVSHPIPPRDEKLAQPWMLEGDRPTWLSRSSWGMAALARVVAEKTGREARIGLPEYFCEQALWPLRRERPLLHFYPVDERGWPDWEKLEGQGPPPDLFYLVHYYGHANDHARARAFCDRTGALLVEDATHALGPDSEIGLDGDVVFYSPWKFFPTPNGALMLVRPRGAALIAPLAAVLASMGRGVAPGLQWIKAAARLMAAGDRTGGWTRQASDFFRGLPIEPMAVRPLASPVSKPVLARQDLAEVARRRRENDAALRRRLLEIPGWAPFDPVPSQAPMRSAFRTQSPEQTAEAYVALRRAGIQADGWPTLPPEVLERGSSGVRLRRTVLNLPCHQGLTPERILAAVDRSGLGGA